MRAQQHCQTESRCQEGTRVRLPFHCLNRDLCICQTSPEGKREGRGLEKDCQGYFLATPSIDSGRAQNSELWVVLLPQMRGLLLLANKTLPFSESHRMLGCLKPPEKAVSKPQCISAVYHHPTHPKHSALWHVTSLARGERSAFYYLLKHSATKK